MSVFDKDNRYLSDIIYTIDEKHPKYNSKIKENVNIDIKGSDYKVLKIENNADNGMQAMAVAPIDKRGNVDTSNVVIAYAGTNAADDLDIYTDAQTIGLSKDTLTYSEKIYVPGNLTRADDNYITKTYRTDAQSVTALAFATELKSMYPNANITTTGHSLGEFLALLVAAENQWMNVGFNGPDPYNNLSKDAKDWVKNNPGWLTNYRNRGDAIGNLMGNGTGAEVKVSLERGRNSLKGTFHSLSTWQFDKSGHLIIPNNEYNQKAIQKQAERQLMNQFALGMSKLELLKKRFGSSGGGISRNEQIYLDDSGALAIVQLASSEFELVMTNTVKIYQDGIRELEELWQQIRSKALNSTPDLSHGEVMKVLESTGCTERSMVTEPSELFREKIAKAKTMSEKFNQLTSEIKGNIAELVQRDQELARQLS